VIQTYKKKKTKDYNGNIKEEDYINVDLWHMLLR